VAAPKFVCLCQRDLDPALGEAPAALVRLGPNRAEAERNR
jgi:hypothetical protein